MKCPTIFTSAHSGGAVSDALWTALAMPLEGLGAGANSNGWADRQVDAVKGPHSGFEVALRSMLLGLAEYADAHSRRYHSKIGDDGVLGREWAAMLSGARGLLNGELDRFDGGTLDKAILAMARAADVEIE